MVYGTTGGAGVGGPGDLGCYYEMKAHMTLNRTQVYIRVNQPMAGKQWVTTAWL